MGTRVLMSISLCEMMGNTKPLLMAPHLFDKTHAIIILKLVLMWFCLGLFTDMSQVLMMSDRHGVQRTWKVLGSPDCGHPYFTGYVRFHYLKGGKKHSCSELERDLCGSI